MSQPTVRQLKLWFNNQESLHKEHSEIDKEIVRLTKEKEDIKHKLRWIDSVSFWHERIPIHEYSGHFSLVIKDEEHRRAYVYLNAHNGKTYGIRIDHGPPMGSNSNERWCGADFPSYEVAKSKAIDYIINGTIPVLD